MTERETFHSVVLPVYNEADNIEPLIAEIVRAMAAARVTDYEVICVDDGSKDDSFAAIQRAATANARVKPMRHTAQYGQSAALLTGIARAGGTVIITLDADGQNDPADIGELLGRLSSGVDAVCGVRLHRKDTRLRRISSRIANRFRRWITGDRFADSGCNFRVMRRTALLNLHPFNGLHRFIPVILESQGHRVIEYPVNHRPRMRGESKYGVGNRLWRGIRDCMGVRWLIRRALPGDRVLAGTEER